MKWVLVAAFVLSLYGCFPAANNCNSGCTGSDGNCMTCSSPYSCNSGGTCSASVNGVACCTGGGGGGGNACTACGTGKCLTNGVCCPRSAPWYDPGGHGYGAGCYASCPYVGDCASQTACC
jgi:hypothetical protein